MILDDLNADLKALKRIAAILPDLSDVGLDKAAALVDEARTVREITPRTATPDA